MKMQECPYVILNQEEADLMADFMTLAGKIISSGLVHSGEALNSLLSSSLYVMISSFDRQILSNAEKYEPSSRSVTILENFIKLVSEYYTEHRNVGFYADKLCLTPKYLSKLIKIASGRSAPEWIDSYVILEAKNLLKYSEMTIKEIVYERL
jgi:AraC-like DNA-binding protein